MYAVAVGAGIFSIEWLGDRVEIAKMKSLSMALAHEVKVIVTLVREPRNYLTDFPKLTEFTPIFDANINKIDLLPDDLCDAVVMFYMGVRLIEGYIPTPQQLTGEEYVVLNDKAKEIMMQEATEMEIELGELLHNDLVRFASDPKSFAGVTMPKRDSSKQTSTS